MGSIGLAFGLTLIAGLSTGIGSLIAFFAKRTNHRFLSIATGFSAGVMLYVSFVEIFFEAGETLTGIYGEVLGQWVNTGAFFAGMLVIGLIDALVPSAMNPHEVHSDAEIRPLRNEGASAPEAYVDNQGLENKKLLRTGLFTALAITLHNFPEGLAVFLSALENPTAGIAIALAIALHNIPEGVSVSVPIYYATGSRWKAFGCSLLSGLAEPFGAVIGYLGLLFFFSGPDGGIPPQVTSVLLSGVAGVMVYISLDELLPTSRAYGKGHDTLLGLLAGMLVMALSLLLLL